MIQTQHMNGVNKFIEKKKNISDIIRVVPWIGNKPTCPFWSQHFFFSSSYLLSFRLGLEYNAVLDVRQTYQPISQEKLWLGLCRQLVSLIMSLSQW